MEAVLYWCPVDQISRLVVILNGYGIVIQVSGRSDI